MRVNVSMREDHKAQVERAAKENGLSVSAYLRALHRWYCDLMASPLDRPVSEIRAAWRGLLEEERLRNRPLRRRGFSRFPVIVPGGEE